jgi:carbonic anhydrase
MSVIDETLRSNEKYAHDFNLAHLAMPPARKIAILACMDARLTIEPMLGLKTGDAHIIRNAGGIASEDALRSLVISHYLLGTQEFMVINHTDCGMVTFKDEDLRARLERETGTASISPEQFHSFSNLEENVRRQVQKLRSHPWIPKSIPVRGFVFDVKTGRLSEVSIKSAATAGD